MTLAELVARDNVQAHWFWTHEVSDGPYTEHEVWDVVFVRNSHEPDLWVTDGETRRTAHFYGLHGMQEHSRRATGGQRIEPDATDTLRDLLHAAAEYDARPTLKEWVVEAYEAGAFDPSVLDHYDEAQRINDTLRRWLGPRYEKYQAVAQED